MMMRRMEKVVKLRGKFDKVVGSFKGNSFSIYMGRRGMAYTNLCVGESCFRTYLSFLFRSLIRVYPFRVVVRFACCASGGW